MIGHRRDVGTSALTPTDAELLGARIDPQVAFAQVFDRHFLTLYRFLARRVGPTDAEDIAVEVFTIAFRQRGDYVALGTSALPWLYGIANNLVSRHRRSEQRYLNALRRVPEAPSPATEEEIVARTDADRLWPVVAAALARLSDDERDALLLFVWADLRYADIAQLVGVPVGTVRSRINRARHRLKTEITTWNQIPS